LRVAAIGRGLERCLRRPVAGTLVQDRLREPAADHAQHEAGGQDDEQALPQFHGDAFPA
jgi:hypothetical protein